MDWDCVRYSDQLNKKDHGMHDEQEEQLGNNYLWLLESAVVHVDAPMTVVDIHSIIMVWYLPEVLTSARQVNAMSNSLSSALINFRT